MVVLCSLWVCGCLCAWYGRNVDCACCFGGGRRLVVSLRGFADSLTKYPPPYTYIQTIIVIVVNNALQRDGPEADQAPAGGEDGQRHAPQPLIIVHWAAAAAAAGEGRRHFVFFCGGWVPLGVWVGRGGETCGERRLAGRVESFVVL